MTRLYIVEGLPCSGKSTASRYVADSLAAWGSNVAYVDEGSGNHPADYEFHAYVPEEELACLPEQLRETVRRGSNSRADGNIVPLSQFRGEDLKMLLPYKIYDGLSWSVEMPLMLEKWEHFVAHRENSTVYVFNCVLLQNPMCETMMRFGFSPAQSLAYISEIVGRTAPLEPAVIYLKNEDIVQSVQSAARERPGWLEAVIDYHMNGAYGKSINAQGFEGYIACLEERQRRELAILECLPVKSLVVENPQRDWAGAYKKIAGFMGTMSRDGEVE